MLLITGAAGKTGSTIIKALIQKKVAVRAFVHSQKQAAAVNQIANIECFIGDLHNQDDLDNAAKGVDEIYYICPNITPDEHNIGLNLISSARKSGVNRFYYHSVLHPQIEAMPHHWQKLRMEESLFTSGLDFTIFQPCAYMQNVLAGLKSIIEEGIYMVPYSVNARISMVDLKDIGEAVANVLTQNGHLNAIYELSGPQALTQQEVAQELSQALNRIVKAEEVDLILWKNQSISNGMDELQSLVLVKMFTYYNNYGLIGNSSVLNFLLGRSPAYFKDFLKDSINPLNQVISGGNK